MLERAILSFVTVCTVTLAACASPTPSTAPSAEPSPRQAQPTAVPTRPVAAPIVKRVSDGKVTGPAPTAHVFIWGQPEATDRDLRLVKEAKFTWAKQRFEWRDIEKEADDAFDWNEADRVVDAINRSGLGIVAQLDEPPEWARARSGGSSADGPPDNLADWKDFVADFAMRYKGKIQAYEIWSEPNLSRAWGGARPDPRAYAQMLRLGYEAIKKVDARALVISAGLSPTSEASDLAFAPTTFLTEMYKAGAAHSFDILGTHAPGYKAAPELDPAEVASDPELTNGDPNPEELRRAYGFRHVEDLRRIMLAYGDWDKQVAIMEMGWTSDPRPNSRYAWYSLTQERQADYLVRAFRYAQQHWSPWIAHMTVFAVPNPRWTGSEEQYHRSIANPDGSARPAYEALRSILPTIVGAEGGASPSPVARPSSSPAARP